MALLKAFMCQVVLFGLYKLFLEEVVESHLVPNELHRNCLVGFVCLLCFGIQVYTDRTADDDYAEDEEDPKVKEAKSVKKCESSITHDFTAGTNGSNTSSEAIVATMKTTTQELATEKKIFTKNHQVTDLRKRDSAPSSTEEDKVNQVTYSVMFAQFSASNTDAIPSVIKEDKIEHLAQAASTVQDISTSPKLNGLSKTVYEESDEESGIEIDHLVISESSEEDAEKFRTAEAVKLEDVMEAEEIKSDILDDEREPEEIKSDILGDVTEAEKIKSDILGDVTEAEEIISDILGDVTEAEEIISDILGDVTEAEEIKALNVDDTTQAEQFRTVDYQENEAVKLEHVTIVDGECLTSNGLKTSLNQVSEGTSSLKIDESETETTNGMVDSYPENEAVKLEHVTIVDGECLTSIGLRTSLTPDLDEISSLKIDGSETETTNGTVDSYQENEAVKVEHVTFVDGECLTANGLKTSLTQGLDETSSLKIDESDTEMTNGAVEKTLVDDTSSNLTEETNSKNSVKNDNEIIDGQETTSASDPDKLTKGIVESLPSAEERLNTISSKVVDEVETVNICAETSKLVKSTVTSPSEKTTESSTREKLTTATDLCVAPVLIDISFIYACH